MEPADRTIVAVDGRGVAASTEGLPASPRAKKQGNMTAALGRTRLDNSELAGETGFSHQMSNSQTTKILTI